MKKVTLIILSAVFIAASFTSCRENKEEATEEEVIIQEMQDEGADVKIKEDDGDTKIKMETDEKEVKIKKEEDGDTKIKVDENN
ncbi:MAG: hypothetical protein COA40_03180 [Aequorivita sp.]|nr:MAG: hypothetical protein COA40_03180 [Aequorivita sp.]